MRLGSALRRFGWLALSAVPALGLLAAPAEAEQTYYVPVSDNLTFNGHGYGHGHGMSQYGAQGAALEGLSYQKIVKFYYPGTRWGEARGQVRVLVSSDWTSDLVVRATQGITVRDLRDRAQWRLPRRQGLDRWRLTPAEDGSTAVQFHDGRGWHRWRIPDGRKTFRSDGQFDARGPLNLLVPSGDGLARRPYRGILRLVRPYAGAPSRDTVNVVGLDQYVQGVVPYEMPASWHPQALRSQAVAARTYAAWQRAQNRTRYYQICDTVSCQVYGGMAAETDSTNSAVRGSATKIVTYQDRPAFTQFSSASGGWTADGGQPYLVAQRDPYDDFAGNPVHDWTKTISASELENAYPEVGELIAVVVTRRDGHGAWGGRVEQAVLDGTAGDAFLTGQDVRWLLDLKSEWFSVSATPIMDRWHALGGRKAKIGPPLSGEFAVARGSVQKFEKGRIFWSKATGARDLRGAILKTYQKLGGTDSRLGLPVKGMMDSPDRGHKAAFQRGFIFSGRRTGAHVLYGRILERWTAAGTVRSWLGYPTTDVIAIEGGQRAKFQGGVISWDRSTDSFSVRRF
ncbi:MAG: SpoIID/LytB domain-containing protein [Nocardioidaceae bacterium]